MAAAADARLRPSLATANAGSSDSTGSETFGATALGQWKPQPGALPQRPEEERLKVAARKLAPGLRESDPAVLEEGH